MLVLDGRSYRGRYRSERMRVQPPPGGSTSHNQRIVRESRHDDNPRHNCDNRADDVSPHDHDASAGLDTGANGYVGSRPE
jgi:hypothetical protein